MRLVRLTTRCVLWAYPAKWRRTWARECLQTIEERCVELSQSHGPLGVLQHVFGEWFNLLRTAVQLRRSGSRSVQMPVDGRPPRRPFTLDVRDTWRNIRSAPAFAAIAIGTLGIGIGANAGLYSVLDSLLFRPLPFAEAHRLTELLNHSIKGGVQFPGFNRALLTEWRSQSDLFDRLEAYDDDFAVFDGAQGAEVVDMAYVTPGLLPMLGVAPRSGRLFDAGDGRDGTDSRVIVSERTWRSHFSSRADFVGSSLRVNGRVMTVVGIMPASFHFPYRSTEMWMPRDLTTPPADLPPTTTMTVFARAVEGVPMDAVAAETQARGERLAVAAGGEPGVTAVTSGRARDDRQRRILQVLAGAVTFLLLIVCANLANLSLSKALARARATAVRVALGATRRDLVREVVLEHLALGLGGAALGVLVAAGVVVLANAILPSALLTRSLNPIDVDLRVLAVAAAAGLLTPVLFGLPATWLAFRGDVTTALTQQSRSVAGAPSARRWRHGLVVAEVTFTMVLLLGAALMGRSLYALVSVDRGFDTTGLVAVRVGFPADRYADGLVRDAFSGDVAAAVRRLPGVSAATVGHVPPNPSGSSFGALEFAHRPGETSDRLLFPAYRVWPDYFDQIGLRLLEGRSFGDAEPASSIIVSDSFARRFWPEGSAVGGQFRFTGGPWRTVVGVSTDVRQLELDDRDGAFEWFVPLRTAPAATVQRRVSSLQIVEHRTFVARSTTIAATLDAIKRRIHELDPSVVIWRAEAVDEAFAAAVAEPRLVLVVIGVMAGLGLLLAAAGLYGVLSFLVTLRLREFGVRLALGAKPHRVFQSILRQGIVLTAIGVLVGGVASVFLLRLMRSVLYEVTPTDPAAFVAVAVTLAIAALVACWRPARRAMRVDPVQLLRES